MPNKTTPQRRSECVFSNMLDIIGDKWSLLVIRDLFFFGKHEYKEFLASPEGIATNILSDRLKRLSAAGIIAEQPHSENRTRKLYYLTEKGKALLPMLVEMALWGADYLPDLPAMQSLYRQIKRDSARVELDVLQKLADWECDNLRAPAAN